MILGPSPAAAPALSLRGTAAMALVLLPLWAAPAGAQALAPAICRARPPLVTTPAEAFPAPLEIRGWRERVAQAERAGEAAPAGRTQLVFLGDSLTARWPRPLFEHNFGRYGALNLGVGGDRTEGLLWRLRNGRPWGPDAGALHPRLAVLLIGTNNLGAGGRAENVAAGIEAVIATIQQHSPGTRILLLQLWPRRGDRGLQSRLDALNAILASCATPPRIALLDLRDALRDPDGGPAEGLFVDGLHLTVAGYAVVAQRLAPAIASLMESGH